MTRRVLVTGVNGFIGRQVARHFSRRGWMVAGLGHRRPGSPQAPESPASCHLEASVSLDALDALGVTPDLVVHCAGGASVSESFQDPDRDRCRTVDSTRELLEFVRLRCHRSAVVHLSSAAVYGNQAVLPIPESAPLKPVSPYGEHKVLSENLCRSYAERDGLSVAIVRFFSVYGPGLRRQLLWDASNIVSRGGNRFHGTGGELRDWVHVADAVRLIHLAADQASSSCPTFNGGAGLGVRVSDVVGRMFELRGRLDSPVFGGEPRAGDPPGYVADIDLAKAIGWEPTMALDEGLVEYCRWYTTNVN